MSYHLITMKRVAIVTMVLVLLAACRADRGPVVVIPPPANDTILGPGDIFDVRVFGEKELSNTFRIGMDGSIDFPLIGQVEVAALEPTAVAEKLENLLREKQMLINPQVSVFVKEYNSKRVSVIGAVARPGAFPLREGLTVVQAIGLAGGFSNLANRNNTELTRRVGEKTVRYRIRVDDVTSGKIKDVLVGSGDIIHVPERAF